MPRHFHDLKDLIIATGILLVTLAGKAGGQVRVAFVEKDEPFDPHGTLLALERSRESLLQARESIDAALLEVDRALLALDNARSLAAKTARAVGRPPASDLMARVLAGAALFREAAESELVRWLPRLEAGLGAALDWLEKEYAMSPLPRLARTPAAEAAAGPPEPATAVTGTDSRPASGEVPGPAPEPAREVPPLAANPAVAREQPAGEAPHQQAPGLRSEALLLPDWREAARLLGIEPAPGEAPAESRRARPEATQR